MRKLIIAAAASLLAVAPAAAQDPYWDDQPYDEEIDEPYYDEDVLPRGAEVAAMAPMLDTMVGAVLDLDVSPILRSADPWRRSDWRGRRTLGELARRDDPHFDDRLSDSIYGTTAAMGRMMDAIASATPAMRRSLRQMEREIDRAVRDADPYRR